VVRSIVNCEEEIHRLVAEPVFQVGRLSVNVLFDWAAQAPILDDNVRFNNMVKEESE